MSENRKIAVFVHSGSYDRLYQLLSIVVAALSNGMEAHLFFSFWALRRLMKGEVEKIELEDEYARFAEKFERKIAEGRIYPISRMLEMIRAMGNVNIYACSASMAILDISKEDLIEEIDQVMGLVTFLSIAEDAEMVLYI